MVGAIFLKWMFIGRFGLIDSTLISLDIFPPNWLGDPIWAKFSLILADTWKFTPFLMLVLYAGLQSLDTQLLEAAQIDGASPVQRLRYVILPMMKPLILFVLAIRVMDAFRFFDLVYRIDQRRSRHGNRNHHALHLPAWLPHAGDGQGLGARHHHAADRRGNDRRADRLPVPPRT